MRPSASVPGKFPVVLAVDVGDERRIGRQLGLISSSLGFHRKPWAGRDDDLEVRRFLGDWLAVGPEEPRLGLAAGLQSDGQVLAGLLAGDVDRGAPLVLRIEDVDACRPSGCQAVQLEAAVADRDLEIAAPEGVERLDAERGEDEAVGDRLAVWPLDAPLDRHARPERRGHFVRRIARLDLIGDERRGAR